MKVLIYVQHLLGTGHVVRAVALARELQRRDHIVTLVSGNRVPATLNVSDLTVRQLPPVSAPDATFTDLVDANGETITDAWREDRARALLDIFEAENPDILITETFPLGRRQFAFELFPVLEAAKARKRAPLIACSVRDILVRKNDARKELWMADTVNSFYDLVLVHADPSFVRLEDSFPYSESISALVRYTGYVHEQNEPAPPSQDGDDEIIVSSGGGAVGLQLLRTAIKARRQSTSAGDAKWRLLVGNNHPDEVFEELRSNADHGIIVERVRPDFQDLLTRARLSVSQAGYNTVLDVIAAKCPAVFVPFEEESESEQVLRAELLKERGLCQVVREAKLSKKRLAKAIDKALNQSHSTAQVHMDGAAAAADILTQEAERRFGR